MRLEPISVAPAGPLAGRIGIPLARLAADLGLTFDGLRRDLRVVGRSIEAHLAIKVGASVYCALLVPGLAAVIALAGGAIPALITLWAAVLLGVAGFFLPDVLTRAEAAERRAEFRHALSSFLDLVVIVLAAGGGVQSALAMAAGGGGGWAFERLGDALAASRLTRETPWAVLGRLGAELGVIELEELAATMSLAGTEGARVRDSLVAKAASLRTHELARAEAEAGAATEHMSFPVALLALGFFVLIGYPAVAAVLSGV
jgi:Flp pilus assembly protein TadB